MSKSLTELQKDFVNMRFGMFIHFNSATVQFHTGELVDWEYGHENYGKPRQFPFDPADWNPVDLDCAQWARAGKTAGVQFAALTTKHHEGFGLWPSAHSQHCVRNASVKRDVVAEYLAAFRNEGICAGLYFSILDLTSAIGKRKCTPADKQLVYGQITELLTNYGEIPFFIIDGWDAPWGGPSREAMPFEEVDALVKGLQPNCLLMNIGDSDIRYTDIAFYESAAGQKIDGAFCGPGASCNYLTGQWFWRSDDPERELRTAQWVVDTIRESNAHNASFILNASPNPRGTLDGNMMQRFAEVGEIYEKLPDVAELPEGWLRR